VIGVLRFGLYQLLLHRERFAIGGACLLALPESAIQVAHPLKSRR